MITRRGTPVARLGPVVAPTRVQRLVDQGLMRWPALPTHVPAEVSPLVTGGGTPIATGRRGSPLSAFFDTSALLALVLGEPRATAIRQILVEHEIVVASAIAEVEARAGLARARRAHRLTARAERDTGRGFSGSGRHPRSWTSTGRCSR